MHTAGGAVSKHQPTARGHDQTDGKGGVMITSVAEDSAAAIAGLQVGDVIERIGRVDIAGVDSYQQLLHRIPVGKPALIRIFRNGQPLFRTIVVQ